MLSPAWSRLNEPVWNIDTRVHLVGTVRRRRLRDVDERQSLGQRRARRRRRASPERDRLHAQVCAEDVAEPLPEDEIDEEVDGRVEDLERVGDVREVVDEVLAPLGLVAPDHLDYTRRGLTQHEDDDDDDHDEGYILLVVAATARHASPPLQGRAVRHRDLGVDERQDEQREYEREYVVEPVRVHALVVRVVAEVRARPVGRVVGVRRDAHLEEARRVVEH